MSTSLMTSRRFAPLFWCQFFSAFNDNFLKNALVFLILFKLGDAERQRRGPDHARRPRSSSRPIFFLSGLGGEMADRFDKALVAQRLKLAEIGVAGLAIGGLLAGIAPAVLFFALFLFGIIAALFGPIKYGILPDHLARDELPAGNALVEGATFIAILLGTIVGGLAAKDGGDPASFAALIMVLRGALLARQPLHPAHRRGGARRSRSIANILRSTAASAQGTCGAISGCGGARRRRAGSGWSAPSCCSLMPPLVKTRARRQRGGRHRSSSPIFSIAIAVGSAPRRLARERPHHPAADGHRRRPHGRLRDRSRLRDLRRGANRDRPGASAPSSGPRSGCRIAIDFAGLAIAGGLFIVPVFRALSRPGRAPTAAPASSPPSTCSMRRPSWSAGTWSLRCLQLARLSIDADPGGLWRSSASACRLRHRADHADASGVRDLAVDRVPRLLPPRGEGPGEHQTRPDPTPSSRSTT